MPRARRLTRSSSPSAASRESARSPARSTPGRSRITTCTAASWAAPSRSSAPVLPAARRQSTLPVREKRCISSPAAPSLPRTPTSGTAPPFSARSKSRASVSTRRAPRRRSRKAPSASPTPTGTNAAFPATASFLRSVRSPAVRAPTRCSAPRRSSARSATASALPTLPTPSTRATTPRWTSEIFIQPITPPPQMRRRGYSYLRIVEKRGDLLYSNTVIR